MRVDDSDCATNGASPGCIALAVRTGQEDLGSYQFGRVVAGCSRETRENYISCAAEGAQLPCMSDEVEE